MTILPPEILVEEIAEEALQAAFAVICNAYDAAGYPVTGDVDPLTSHVIDGQFAGYVRMMGVNNDRIAQMNDLWDAVGEPCDECGALIPTPSELVNFNHMEACSLHPASMIGP